jgi:hypothetical protein
MTHPRWPIYFTLKDIEANRKEVERRKAKVSDFRINSLNILDCIPRVQEELRTIEQGYIAKGRAKKHNLENYWDLQKINRFTNLLYELGLEDVCTNCNPSVDAVYQSEFKIRKGELIALPTRGQTANEINRLGTTGLAGITFGGTIGGFIGLIFSTIYALNSSVFNEYIFYGIAGATSITCAAGLAKSLNGRLKKKYLSINPFSTLADEIGNRAKYIQEKLK